MAGQLPMDPLDPERIRPNSPFEAQMQQLLSNCAALLQAAGSWPQAVLSLTVYLDDLAHWDEMDRCCAAFFASHRPARTVLGVAAIRKGYAVQASLVAVRP
ncbi:RidA family protein [Paucibacter soli]|uniref:RidA family protein n=1 Tax=Paucibacter soli TaxID=3133433 RepID=UPI00309B8D8D